MGNGRTGPRWPMYQIRAESGMMPTCAVSADPRTGRCARDARAFPVLKFVLAFAPGHGLPTNTADAAWSPLPRNKSEVSTTEPCDAFGGRSLKTPTPYTNSSRISKMNEDHPHDTEPNDEIADQVERMLREYAGAEGDQVISDESAPLPIRLACLEKALMQLGFEEYANTVGHAATALVASLGFQRICHAGIASPRSPVVDAMLLKASSQAQASLLWTILPQD